MIVFRYIICVNAVRGARLLTRIFKLVIDAGVCRRLVELLRHTSSTIQVRLFRSGAVATNRDVTEVSCRLQL